MEMSCQFHAPGALSPGKDPRSSLDMRLSGHQSRSGRGGEEKEHYLNCPQQGIEHRSYRSLY
jgi:hypothetical protein